MWLMEAQGGGTTRPMDKSAASPTKEFCPFTKSTTNQSLSILVRGRHKMVFFFHGDTAGCNMALSAAVVIPGVAFSTCSSDVSGSSVESSVAWRHTDSSISRHPWRQHLARSEARGCGNEMRQQVSRPRQICWGDKGENGIPTKPPHIIETLCGEYNITCSFQGTIAAVWEECGPTRRTILSRHARVEGAACHEPAHGFRPSFK